MKFTESCYPFYQKLMKSNNPYRDAKGRWTSKDKTGTANSASSSSGGSVTPVGGVDVNPTYSPASISTLEVEHVMKVEPIVSATIGNLTVIVPKGSESLGNTALKEYSTLPKVLTSHPLKMYFSSFANPQDEITGKQYDSSGSSKFVTQATTSTKGDSSEIFVWGKGEKPQSIPTGTLAHELSHTIDVDNYKFSNSQEYADAVAKDKAHSGGVEYITPYAGESAAVYPTHKYSEDFADSIEMYMTSQTLFIEKCPFRAEYLYNVLDKLR